MLVCCEKIMDSMREGRPPLFRMAARFLSRFGDQIKATTGTDSGTLVDSSVWKKLTWPLLMS